MNWIIKAMGDEAEQGEVEEVGVERPEIQKPESPPPGEGAFSFPRTSAGKAPVQGSGARPVPSAGSAPRPEGAPPVVRSGERAFYTPGQASMNTRSPQGDDYTQEQFAGHNVQGEGASFGYAQKLSDTHSGNESTDPRALNRSLGQGFCVVKKSDGVSVQTKNIKGIKVCVENPHGSIRSGESDVGVKWQTTMLDDYGYIPGVLGVDGDSLDVFLGPVTRKKSHKDDDWDKVWVIHGTDPLNGKYDEDKVMLGYRSKTEAIGAYRGHYDDPDKFIGPVSEYTLDKFKKILNKLKTQGKSRRLGRGVNPID